MCCRATSQGPIIGLVIALGLAWPAVALADTIVLEPARDNTLFGGFSEANSNGAGPHLFAGEASFAGPRRALLEFDVAGALPAGAVVEGVTLTLHLSLGVGPEQPLALHRILAEWGEGSSNSGTGAQGTGSGGGAGAPATPGDATWLNTFFPDLFWTTPGGDFEAVESSVAMVANVAGDYSWNSTPAMVADVQTWLDNPEQNHGWLILGPELGDFVGKAKRFESREFSDPAMRPRLTIEFSTGTTGCATCAGDLDGNMRVDGADLQGFIDCLLDAAPGTSCACGDIDNDGAPSAADVALFVDRLLESSDCQP